MEAYPFDPETQVSADAKHVVKHLWIIGVLLPVLVAVVSYILTKLASL